MSTLNDRTETTNTPAINDSNRKTVRMRQNKTIFIIIDRLGQTTIKITTNPSERRYAVPQQNASRSSSTAAALSCSFSLRTTIPVMCKLKRY